MTKTAGQQMAEQANANNNKVVFGAIIINVKAYGAKGDGIADDTASIQAAIDYAISIGKHEVTFPAGTYKYGVLLNTSGMIFVGDGVTLIGTTVLTLTSFSSYALLPSSIKELSSIQQLPPYRTFFIDDFTTLGNYNATTSFGIASDPWTVSSNTISSPSAITNTTDLQCINKDIKLSDGKVSAIWENPNTTLTASFGGIAFRGKGLSDLLVAIVFPNTKTVGLWKFSNGSYSQLASSAITAAQVVTSKPLVIEAEIIGIRCIVKVNGKTYINFTDANIISYSNGYCGLVASSTAAEFSTKTFSNFTISEKIFDAIVNGAANYLCLGDSITWGAGATIPYPSIFNTLLSTYLGKLLTTTNAGVSSDTTALMLARLITLLAAGTYNVVTVMGGTNDSRIDLSVSISTAIANISEMIKRIKSHGAIPVICTVPPISLAINNAYTVVSYNYIVRMNSRIRQLCIKEKVKCVDVFSAFNDDIATYISADLLHPNDAGYQLIAQTIFNTVVNKY